jgi:hypothetical protein
MSAVRKHESFNQSVNEKQERKQLKEEEQRLMKMSSMKVLKRRKAGGRFVMDYDFNVVD